MIGMSFRLAALLLAGLAIQPEARAQGAFHADPANGCKAWSPNPSPDLSIRWEGRCANGFASGKGKLSLITPAARAEYSSYWLDGHMIGRYERVGFDADGTVKDRSVGYEPNETGLSDFYQKTAGPNGGFSVKYFVGPVLQGVYRQDMTDNRERAAYLLEDGEDRNDKRRKAVFLVRYNPTTKAWSSWPNEENRSKDRLDAYAVVTGEPSKWHISECADHGYEACVELFQQKLADFGYADWPLRRMESADANWAEQLKRFAALQKATEAHAALLKSGAADKLFTYGSRQEQEGHYGWALDAYRAIVERFPKSKFFDLAAARMPAVQDKLDRQAEKMQAEMERAAQEQARQQVEAQRLEMQKAENQRRSAEAARLRSQRQVVYDQCLARAEKCLTECYTSGGIGLVAGLAGLANPKAANLDGLNQINQKTQSTCNRCEAVKAECEREKP